jgi:DNA adenine methylase
MSATPFIKWSGGKRSLRNAIIHKFPSSFGNYFEPFLGGGAIGLHMSKDVSWFSDSNLTLINTYKYIRDDLKSFLREVDSLINIHNASHDRVQLYYVMRNAFNISKDGLLKSALFLYLNKTCFNGLYRVNQKGEFNTPIGKYNNINFYDIDNMKRISSFLQYQYVDCYTFDKIENLIQPYDLVYFDPPYHPISETSNFRSYTSEGFSGDTQIELRNMIARLTKKNVYCVVSNSNCEFIRQIYSDFDISELETNRSISGDSKGRGKLKELLIRNYN